MYLLRHSPKDTNAAKMLQKKYLSNSSLNQKVFALLSLLVHYTGCLLYTSDAADDKYFSKMLDVNVKNKIVNRKLRDGITSY